MKNRNFYFGLIFFVLVISGYINFKVFWSFIEQNALIYEFNAHQTRIPLEAVKTFNEDIPNISATTLPLKMLKARYFLKNSFFDEGLRLLYESNKANPYLGINDALLGQYHFNKSNFDSAFYYSKKAFEALPRNDVHSKLYFQTLTKLKMDSILDLEFFKIKENYLITQWRDYIFSKIEIGLTPKEELIPLLEEAKERVLDPKKFNTLETILKVGVENLNELNKIIIEAEKAYKQDKFLESANLYQKAALIDNQEYSHYENAALSYYRGDYFEEAEKLFRYSLRAFDIKNGKSEFYLGLLLYELKKKEEACEFWKISRQKGFSGSQRVIETFCK